MTLPARTRRPAGRLCAVGARIAAVAIGLGVLLNATPSGAGGPPAPFALARLDDGTPARWEPCRTVTYSVDPRYAPPGALADLQQALRLTEAASGLVLVPTGPGADTPQRSWLRPGGWPEGTADLVVAWAVPGAGGAAVPGTSDLLGPDGPAGVGGWSAERTATTGSAGRIVRAFVVLDARADAAFARGFRPAGGVLGDRRAPRGRLLLHELGHAVGLAHVDDERQVMHSQVQPVGGAWAQGDVAGLRALRADAPCGSPGGSPGGEPDPDLADR